MIPVPSRLLPAALCVLAIGFSGLNAPARAEPYADLVNEARDHLQNERYVEALASARDATRLQPGDYKSYYYLAMAYLGLARYDEADSAAAQALSLANDLTRASVDKLVKTIKARRIAATSQQEADTALADGLNGKAARLYEMAWSAERANAEAGLKAADLYANRLSQPVDAARVLRQIRTALKGTPDADKADSQLRQLSETLQKIAQARVSGAKDAPCDKALEHLKLAEDADPTMPEIYSARMRCVNTPDDFKNNLKGLARLNLATPDNLFALQHIGVWMKKPEVQEFMTDLIGKTQADDLLQRLNERQAAADAAMAKYRADLAAWEQKTADDKALYARKLTEKEACLAACTKKFSGLFGNAQKLEACNTGCTGEAERFVPKEEPKPVAPVQPD